MCSKRDGRWTALNSVPMRRFYQENRVGMNFSAYEYVQLLTGSPEIALITSRSGMLDADFYIID